MNDEVIDETFGRIASHVASKYRGVAEAADVKQELWVWWLSHEKPELTDADWALRRTLFTVAERYCQKERKARGGTDTEHYSTDEIFTLVELLVSPPSDDAHTTDRLGAELSEVFALVAALPDDLRLPLCAHAAGESFRQMSERLGLPLTTTYRRVELALTTIAKNLNGESA